MLKFLKKCVITCLVVFFSVGCSSSISSAKSYTFEVETGDNVKVTLDTSNKDDLKQKDGQFSIEKNKKVLSQGVFINKSTYEQYVSMLLSDSNLTVIDNGKTDDYSYFFYEYNGDAGVEHDYVVWLKGSSTGILIGSLKSKKVAQNVFEKLTFEIDD